MPLGPTAQYLAKYNSYTLPGYVQNETLESTSNIAAHYAPYADGSNSEYTGLSNKLLSLRLKVWEADYLTCKTEVEKAATMLRSSRSGFSPLYVQFTDRYYEAMTRSIKVDKEAGTSTRTLEYEAEFECRPWLTSETTYTISGTGLQTTDVVSRTISDGGWAPTITTVTGTNVTISGYTSTGAFTGFISISGAVTNMVIDAEKYTATIGGVNKNNLMLWADYALWVGPEKTYFDITGASACKIAYRNRWYL